ncbi:class I SAM-dependent methyltransferase [Candidatus Harpocratesius sp.]
MNESDPLSLFLSQKKKKEIQALYNEKSYVEIYDNRYGTLQSEKFSLISAKEMEFSDVWLDFGCGTGLTWDFIINSQDLEKFLTFRFRYIGCDLSSEMLLKFKSKWIEHDFKDKKVNDYPHLICADGENLPFRNSAISNVISLTTLQNLPNPMKGIKEISRITRKDANLISKIMISVLKKKYHLGQWKKWLSEIFSSPNFTLEIINNSTDSNIEDWIFYIHSKIQ